jgi:hypothetical protein
MKKTSQNQINLKKWIEKGNTIPKCINDGCQNDVSIRHWTSNFIPSLKTECYRCSYSRKKDKKVKGIVFHKKNYCENRESILGFLCPMDQNRYDEFPTDIFHLDHLDGNHQNNILENLKTFCAICHIRKGKENKDYNGYKPSSSIHKI